MTQSRGKALRQRMPTAESSQSSSDSELYESNFRREIFLDYDQWQNIAEDKLPWYEYNRSSVDRKEVIAIQHVIIPCIREIIASGLTSRQKEIVTMYFLHKQTQVSIARKLGISQPTVNQHLNGKKRNGKKVGGSIRRIRKVIRRMSSACNSHPHQSHIINTLDQLLNETTGIRKSNELMHCMLK